jgi:hypothetical protein
MNENQIADIWILFKDYLDKKSQETAAERYVELLADYGVGDKMLAGAQGTDEVLDDAIAYYLDEEDKEEENDDYFDEDDDY